MPGRRCSDGTCGVPRETTGHARGVRFGRGRLDPCRTPVPIPAHTKATDEIRRTAKGVAGGGPGGGAGAAAHHGAHHPAGLRPAGPGLEHPAPQVLRGGPPDAVPPRRADRPRPGAGPTPAGHRHPAVAAAGRGAKALEHQLVLLKYSAPAVPRLASTSPWSGAATGARRPRPAPRLRRPPTRGEGRPGAADGGRVAERRRGDRAGRVRGDPRASWCRTATCCPARATGRLTSSSPRSTWRRATSPLRRCAGLFPGPARPGADRPDAGAGRGRRRAVRPHPARRGARPGGDGGNAVRGVARAVLGAGPQRRAGRPGRQRRAGGHPAHLRAGGSRRRRSSQGTRAEAEAGVRRLARRLAAALRLGDAEADEWAAGPAAAAGQGRPGRAAARGAGAGRAAEGLPRRRAATSTRWTWWSGCCRPGKRPVKRPLPSLRPVRTARHLHRAAQRSAPSACRTPTGCTSRGWSRRARAKVEDGRPRPLRPGPDHRPARRGAGADQRARARGVRQDGRGTARPRHRPGLPHLRRRARRDLAEPAEDARPGRRRGLHPRRPAAAAGPPARLAAGRRLPPQRAVHALAGAADGPELRHPRRPGHHPLGDLPVRRRRAAAPGAGRAAAPAEQAGQHTPGCTRSTWCWRPRGVTARGSRGRQRRATPGPGRCLALPARWRRWACS